jgi:enamine deaminase RidA (YjgF/YER057c/UK114 family)
MRYFLINYDDVKVIVEVAEISPNEKVKEFHAILHVDTIVESFHNQLQYLCVGISRLFSEALLQNAQPIFTRCFLSDAANQYTETAQSMSALLTCPISYVQQPLVDGRKIAVWMQFQTDVHSLSNGIAGYEHNGYTQYFNILVPQVDNNTTSYQQTRSLLEDYELILRQYECTMEHDCVRTWFFARDIDCDYKGVVAARKENFESNGLTKDTHFIASTGIQGSTANHNIKVLLDAYAIKGLEKSQIRFLYARENLSSTYDYGVTFERGVSIDFGDRRKVLISGTASIDNKGSIMFEGDIEKQVLRMWDNVEALLIEAECGFSDIMQMIVYLRDIADCRRVKMMFDEKFGNVPRVIVLAPICRPGWLVEMECIAIKEIENSIYRDF